uniref:Uncharacterized protein n=1 Tax=Arundo donax TaxID=35708 RepID=A0A0A9BMC5_ARUDO
MYIIFFQAYIMQIVLFACHHKYLLPSFFQESTHTSVTSPMSRINFYYINKNHNYK